MTQSETILDFAESWREDGKSNGLRVKAGVLEPDFKKRFGSFPWWKVL